MEPSTSITLPSFVSLEMSMIMPSSTVTLALTGSKFNPLKIIPLVKVNIKEKSLIENI